MRFGSARIMGSPSAIAQSGNLYLFTMGNPVKWLDPTGLFAIPGLLGPIFNPVANAINNILSNVVQNALVLACTKKNHVISASGGSGSSMGGVNTGGHPISNTTPLRVPSPNTTAGQPRITAASQPVANPPTASTATTARIVNNPLMQPTANIFNQPQKQPAIHPFQNPPANTNTWQSNSTDLRNINPQNPPAGWTTTTNNGFTHVRDPQNRLRIEVHPADRVTNYKHVHFKDTSGNPLNVHGNIVDFRSVDAHMPIEWFSWAQ